MPEWFIKLFTKENDTVLDPFMGSGSTGVAALQLGRAFLGNDISDAAHLVARKRLGPPDDPTREPEVRQPSLFGK